MIRNLKRLVLRAFPELGGYHVTRLGVVVAIPNPTDEEQGTDRFRPRYAADVQLLTPGGQPDESRPLLQGLPLPSHGGVYAFPELGQRVRIGYDYGLPSHPYIVALVQEGQPLPALRPGERPWQHSDGNYIRFDAKGNLRLQTDGELREDSHTRTIEADATSETHGALATAVDGDWTQEVGGRLVQEVLGALQQKIAGDMRAVILEGLDQVVGGDKREMVGTKLELVSALDVTVRSALGDVLVDEVAGSSTLQSAVKSSVVSTLVDLGLSATDALVLGNAFLLLFNAHPHSSAGAGAAQHADGAGHAHERDGEGALGGTSCALSVTRALSTMRGPYLLHLFPLVHSRCCRIANVAPTASAGAPSASAPTILSAV
jgi:hypothetical protein